MKKKILFFGEGIALSHIVRPLYLAKGLARDRYEVAFACPKSYCGFAEGSVDKYYELTSMSSEEFEKRIQGTKPIYDEEIVSKYVKSELEIMSDFKPDIVVGDMRITLALSAKQVKVPYINLCNGYWSKNSAQKRIMPEIPELQHLPLKVRNFIVSMVYPKVVKGYVKEYNKRGKLLGLPIAKTMQDVNCNGDYNMYIDIPSLAPVHSIPDTDKYIGPITELFDNELPSWWNVLPTDKPIVYFTTGSTGNVSLVNAIIAALKRLPVTVVMSTAGRSFSEKFPENFYVEKYLPATQVIAKSSLVICNGTGAINQAFVKGKPIIAFAQNADQFLAMDMVVKNGAGKLIRPDKAKEEHIYESIKTILEQPIWHQQAQKLQKEIEQYQPMQLFQKYLDEIVSK